MVALLFGVETALLKNCFWHMVYCTCCASQLHEFFRASLDLESLRILYCKTHKRMVSLQYGFSCVFSEYHFQQMIYHITDICMSYLQYGFSRAFSDYHFQ